MSVQHYENFPVASWLCPPALRPAVQAIYWFARTADDIADEGDAPAAARLHQLAEYRAALLRAAGGDVAGPWSHVFAPLSAVIGRHALPMPLLTDLLSAFEQDTRNPIYADRAALLDYCARSANPVGRLLLHLYGLHEPVALRQADAVCSALQLINFWQDLSVDIPRGRHYVPRADAAAAGRAVTDLGPAQATALPASLLAGLVGWSRALMHEGAPLVHRIPGRAGWELRLVVQGGLRVLDRIESLPHGSWAVRPKLSGADVAPIVWRALTMRARPAQPSPSERAA